MQRFVKNLIVKTPQNVYFWEVTCKELTLSNKLGFDPNSGLTEMKGKSARLNMRNKFTEN